MVSCSIATGQCDLLEQRTKLVCQARTSHRVASQEERPAGEGAPRRRQRPRRVGVHIRRGCHHACSSTAAAQKW